METDIGFFTGEERDYTGLSKLKMISNISSIVSSAILFNYRTTRAPNAIKLGSRTISIGSDEELYVSDLDGKRIFGDFGAEKLIDDESGASIFDIDYRDGLYAALADNFILVVDEDRRKRAVIELSEDEGGRGGIVRLMSDGVVMCRRGYCDFIDFDGKRIWRNYVGWNAENAAIYEGIFGQYLYVSDMNTIRIFDISDGKEAGKVNLGTVVVGADIEPDIIRYLSIDGSELIVATKYNLYSFSFGDPREPVLINARRLENEVKRATASSGTVAVIVENDIPELYAKRGKGFGRLITLKHILEPVLMADMRRDLLAIVIRDPEGAAIKVYDMKAIWRQIISLQRDMIKEYCISYCHQETPKTD